MVAVFGFFSLPASANSYYILPFPESELPEEIVDVAVFKRHAGTVYNGRMETIEKGDLSPDAEVIRYCFRHGIHTHEKPVFEYEKALAELEEFVARFPEPASAEHAATLEARFTAIRDKIRRFSGSVGAVIDERGRIILWRLHSPSFLEVYSSNEGVCYLQIAERHRAELTERTVSDSFPGIPAVDAGDFLLSSYFLPAVNRDYPIPRKILREFGENGVITDLTCNDLPVLDRDITEYSVPITKSMLRYRKEWERDVVGTRILKGGRSGIADQFRCVFCDSDGSLWRADLLNDGHFNWTTEADTFSS